MEKVVHVKKGSLDQMEFVNNAEEVQLLTLQKLLASAKTLFNTMIPLEANVWAALHFQFLILMIPNVFANQDTENKMVNVFHYALLKPFLIKQELVFVLMEKSWVETNV